MKDNLETKSLNQYLDEKYGTVGTATRDKFEIELLEKTISLLKHKITDLEKQTVSLTIASSNSDTILLKANNRISWLEGLLKSAVYHVDAMTLVELINLTLENKNATSLENLHEKTT